MSEKHMHALKETANVKRTVLLFFSPPPLVVIFTPFPYLLFLNFYSYPCSVYTSKLEEYLLFYTMTNVKRRTYIAMHRTENFHSHQSPHTLTL